MSRASRQHKRDGLRIGAPPPCREQSASATARHLEFQLPFPSCIGNGNERVTTAERPRGKLLLHIPGDDFAADRATNDQLFPLLVKHFLSLGQIANLLLILFLFSREAALAKAGVIIRLASLQPFRLGCRQSLPRCL